MQTKTTIKCPNCETKIDVNKVLYSQFEQEFEQKNITKEKHLKQKEQQIDSEIEKKVLLKIKKEKETLKKIIEKEQFEAINMLQKELEEKSKQVMQLNKSKVEIEKLKRENKEIEYKIKAEAENQLNAKLEIVQTDLKKQIINENELKFKQKDEQLKQLQKQLQLAQIKAEQGSSQLQGEVQELAIEEYLSKNYPFDKIEEIKKGARGADCIQIVNTRDMANCGKIYYESKRAKDFNKNWLEKFKADMREKAVDIGVLVTSVYPANYDKLSMIDGVWVCSFDEFKGLSAVLRDSLIKINQIHKNQENKTEKTSILYNYLTSSEFKMQIEAIVEGFTTLKTDLDKEKRAMARIWKQREKQIEKVLDNTINMYGSIKGIAGNAIENVPALELPYFDEN